MESHLLHFLKIEVAIKMIVYKQEATSTLVCSAPRIVSLLLLLDVGNWTLAFAKKLVMCQGFNVEMFPICQLRIFMLCLAVISCMLNTG